MYTREEIEAYVERNLVVIGENSIAQEAEIRANFADRIAVMPPSHQSILIESRRMNYAGDPDEVQRHWGALTGGDRPVNGFFIPDNRIAHGQIGTAPLSRAFSRLPSESVVWNVEANRASVVEHEVGHLLDFQVGRHLTPTEPQFWSAGNDPSWVVAISGESSGGLEPVALAPEERFYPDERGVAEHLSLYPEAERRAELMAETEQRYIKLYDLHNGDAEKIDKAMQTRSPHAWAVFKEKYLPKVEGLSDELQGRRMDSIERFVDYGRTNAALEGREFDEAAIRRQAGVYAAGGSLKNVERSVELQRDLQEYRHSISYEGDPEGARNNPFTFDEEAAKAEAHRVLSESGPQGLLDHNKAIGFEKKALVELNNRYGYLDNSIQRALGENAGSARGEDILEKFDQHMKEGGVEAVTAAATEMKIPSDEVKQYISAREQNAAIESQLAREGKVSWGKRDGIYEPLQVADKDLPEGFDNALAEDIRRMGESGNGREIIAAETERLRLETDGVIRQAEGFPPRAVPDAIEEIKPTAVMPDTPVPGGSAPDVGGSFGRSAMRAAAPVMRHLPAIGTGAAIYFASTSKANAAEGLKNGDLTQEQHDAIVESADQIVAAEADPTGAVALATEEIVEARLKAMDVPEEYRFGTLREAITDFLDNPELDARFMDTSIKPGARAIETIDDEIVRVAEKIGLIERDGRAPDVWLRDPEAIDEVREQFEQAEYAEGLEGLDYISGLARQRETFEAQMREANPQPGRTVIAENNATADAYTR